MICYYHMHFIITYFTINIIPNLEIDYIVPREFEPTHLQ